MELAGHNSLHWHKIADNVDSIEWNSDQLAKVQVGERFIALAKVKGEVFACTDRCPHASGSMSNGFLDAAGNIVCPLHKYKFNLHNGRNVSGEGYKLKVFAIETRIAGIFIGIEADNIIDLSMF